MLKRVKDFLASHWDGKRPLLLGYSGGPDSKALFYTLLELGCKTLHLAHVDHAWRPESREEAELLKKEAERLQLPFHSIRLSAQFGENDSRRLRFDFFRSLFEVYPFQALLLAHHEGDLAETVLKRVLEGAHLPFLRGMTPSSHFNELAIWRPLLSIKKEEIIQFLEARNIAFLTDPTNFDPVYLRARMRMEILPQLADQFGKEISNNLALLSQRAGELKAYLHKKTEKVIPSRGPWGLFGFLADLDRIEARYLLQEWAEREKIRLSRSLIEPLLDAIAQKRPNYRITSRVLSDRGYVFFISEAPPPAWGKEPLLLKQGSWKWGEWTVDVVENQSHTTQRLSTHWKEVWTGRFVASIPRGTLLMPSQERSLRHFWNVNQVPAFFRDCVPIISRERGRSYEFLTGKISSEMDLPLAITVSSHSRRGS